MNHIQAFNEHVGGPGSSTARVGGPSAHGNTGIAGGFTGPVAFHAQNNISGNIPTLGADFQDNDDEDLPDYPKAKTTRSFINDVKGKMRKRPEEDLFGKSKRRVDKLKAQLNTKEPKRGLFSDEKERIDAEEFAVKKSKSIKSFSDFSKD